MGQALTNFDRAGSVRRVLRRGDQHVCGLCRNEYGDVAVAQACVVRCWSEYLAMNPVLKRSKGKQVNYRCRFCARDYLEAAEAISCGSVCRDKLKAAFEVEAMLTEEVGEIPLSPPKRVKPRLKMIYLQPPRVIKKKAPAPEATEAPATDAVAAPTPQAEGASNATAEGHEEHSKEAAKGVEVKKVDHA